MAAVFVATLRPLRPPHAGRPLQTAHRDAGSGPHCHREGPLTGAGIDRETHWDTCRECSRNYDGESRLPGRGNEQSSDIY